MRWLVLVVVLGCASASTPSNSASAEEDRGPTRADIDPAVEAAPQPGNRSYRVSVHADHVDVLSDDGFPGRALEPVLHAGAVELHDYEHVGVTTLRFATEGEMVGPFVLVWGSDRYELSP